MPIRSVCTGGGDASSAASTAVTYTLAGSEQVGDVILVFPAENTTSNTATAVPTLTVESGPTYSASGVMGTYCQAKVLTSGDISTGTVVVTWSGTSARQCGVAVVVYGGSLANIVVGTTVSQTTAATVVAPTVTTTINNSEVIGVVFTRNNTTTTPIGITIPATYTSRKVASTNYGTTPQYSVTAASLTTTGVAGNYGGDTWTLTGQTPTHTQAYTIALAPTVVTGTVGSTWGALSASVTGVVTKFGTVASSWGALAASISGTVTSLGTASSSWGALTASITGSVSSGTVSGGEELQHALNRVAGTTGLSPQGAANAWASTTGKALLGALNAKATARGYAGPTLELQGILNQLAGTTGLGINGAAANLT